MDVDLGSTTELSDHDLQELRQLRALVDSPQHVRPVSPLLPVTWAGIEDRLFAVRVRSEGVLVSSLYVTQRSILVNGSRTLAGGIRTVMTHPEYRRRGYARAALERAIPFMWQDLHVDLGLLFSSPMAVPLYASQGWTVFDGPVLCAQPNGTIDYTAHRLGHPPMVLLRAESQTASGAIDLCGLPW